MSSAWASVVSTFVAGIIRCLHPDNKIPLPFHYFEEPLAWLRFDPYFIRRLLLPVIGSTTLLLPISPLVLCPAMSLDSPIVSCLDTRIGMPDRIDLATCIDIHPRKWANAGSDLPLHAGIWHPLVSAQCLVNCSRCPRYGVAFLMKWFCVTSANDLWRVLGLVHICMPCRRWFCTVENAGIFPRNPPWCESMLRRKLRSQTYNIYVSAPFCFTFLIVLTWINAFSISTCNGGWFAWIRSQRRRFALFSGSIRNSAGGPADVRKTKQHRYFFFPFYNSTKLYNGLSVYILSYICESLGEIGARLTVEFWANHNALARVRIWW